MRSDVAAFRLYVRSVIAEGLDVKPPAPPYQHIFFDCDSTLSAVEGIDELARRAGLYEELAPLTEAAMDGRIALETIYRTRLERLRPTRLALNDVADLYVEKLVPGARETVAVLHALGKSVHIISGGLQQAVEKLGSVLHIDWTRVHAVSLSFDSDGNYQDYDDDSPLTRVGGKSVVCVSSLRPGEHAALIGDGITDLDAESEQVAFVGFGGVVVRESVKKSARVFVDAPDLRSVLPALLTDAELEQGKELGFEMHAGG